MTGQIEKRIDFCDCHSLFCFPYFFDLVTCAYFAFLKNTEIESGTSIGGQQCRHSGLVQSDANAIAGNTWLRHLEDGASDPITIPDADHLVGQSFDGEILSELSTGVTVAQVRPLQLILPITIRLDLVHEDRS